MSVFDEVLVRLGDGWTGVTVREEGGFWCIAGDHSGTRHSGARADYASLADDLARIARELAAMTPAAPVSAPAAPVWVRPEPHVDTATPLPIEPALADAAGDTPAPNLPPVAFDVAATAAPDVAEPPPRLDAELVAAPDIGAMRAILRQRIAAEMMRRSGITSLTLRRAAELTAIINDPATSPEAKRDAMLEAEQFGELASSAAPFEDVRVRKEMEVLELKTVEEIYAYDTLAGWPEK